KSAGFAASTHGGDCPSGADQWVSFEPSAYGPVGYYRDPQGVVHLSGVALQCGNPPGHMLTLPRGYRPKFALYQIVDKNLVEPGEIEIFNDGTVDPYNSVSGARHSLAGLTFRC